MYVGKHSCVRGGFSAADDPVDAARELYESIRQPGAVLGVFFCSTEHDIDRVGQALSRSFGDLPLIGCTSAGEITPGGYLSGAVTGFTLAGPDFQALHAPLPDPRHFSIGESQNIVRQLKRDFDSMSNDGNEDKSFAFLLLDGLSKCEELVISTVSAALGAMPLVGGSSGGDLSFQKARVFANGRFASDGGVLVLVRTQLPFQAFTTDHFVGSATRMVVTEADPANRIVSEINAEPAGPEYARLIGIDVEALSPMVFATHPVVVKVGGRYYTRSIQKLNPDGSLSFFCAIDKGIVLTTARGTDIVANLRGLFDHLRSEIGSPQLVIGCDCILRTLELERRQLKQSVGQLFAENNVIGFSTYGEQFQAMHVNQTFTGVAIGAGDRLH